MIYWLVYDPSLDVEGRYHEAVTLDLNRQDLTVEQPSLQGYLDTIKGLEGNAADHLKRIKKMQEDIEMGLVSKGIIRGLKRAEEERALFLQQLLRIRNFDRHFGSVLATSGYNVASEGHTLDWGLIHVQQNRIGYNRVSPNI